MTPDATAELTPAQDFYDLESVLADDDRRLLAEIRSFMGEEVAPIINDYWSREEFPHRVWPRMAELGLGGMALDGPGCAGRRPLLDGFVAMEMAAVDCSVATGLGVHNHLAMGSIAHCGSEEQKGALAAAHGGLRRDRGVRSHGARRRLRRRSRAQDDGTPRQATPGSSTVRSAG